MRVLILIGFGCRLLTGPRQNQHILVCAGVIAYMVTLQMFLTAEPRYLNGVFLLAVPLPGMGVGQVGRPRWAAPKGDKRE
ncbi:MAG: hypothetical protein ABR551_07520 [Gemmatimonadales bacterium]